MCVEQDGTQYNEVLKQFFKGVKSENVRDYTRKILQYLENAKISNGVYNPLAPGWVRSKELYSALVETKIIPHSTQFFRIIRELSNLKIVETTIDTTYTGKGKKPIYYRLPTFYNGDEVLDRDDMMKKLDDVREQVSYLLERAYATDLILAKLDNFSREKLIETIIKERENPEYNKAIVGYRYKIYDEIDDIYFRTTKKMHNKREHKITIFL